MKRNHTNSNNPMLHENIIMSNCDLPINFHEHVYSNCGPFCILHWHSEIELVYVEKGMIATNCNSNTIVAKEGDFIFVNSNELHDYSVLSAPISLLCCTIDLSILQGRYLSSYDSKFLNPLSQKVILFENHIVNDEVIKNHFLSMWSEHRSKNAGYEYAIKASLYGIMSILVRRYIKSNLTNQQYASKNSNLLSINKVIRYIEANYAEMISLNDLASLLNVNRYYFCRFFKEITGTTPIEYINKYRIHQAISAMQDCPETTITQIATSVGYNDTNYFTKVFKSITNTSPSEYKRLLARQYSAEKAAAAGHSGSALSQ